MPPSQEAPHIKDAPKTNEQLKVAEKAGDKKPVKNSDELATVARELKQEAKEYIEPHVAALDQKQSSLS